MNSMEQHDDFKEQKMRRILKVIMTSFRISVRDILHDKLRIAEFDLYKLIQTFHVHRKQVIQLKNENKDSRNISRVLKSLEAFSSIIANVNTGCDDDCNAGTLLVLNSYSRSLEQLV